MLQERTGPAELSAAIVYASRTGSERLVLFADEAAGTSARLAGWLQPGFDIEVRTVTGSDSRAALPEPLPVVLPGPADACPLVEQMDSAGLEVLLEGGEWRGELLGLEVARIVRWPRETGGDDRLHIEAGVGRFDRDAAAAMHQGESPRTGLDRAIRMVSQRRHQGAPTEPLSILARSRWLRSVALADPSVVGAVTLAPVEATSTPDSVREERPAAALGSTPDGERVLVVFAAGGVLEMVPVAVDTRELQLPGGRLRLVLPPKDRMKVFDELVTAATSADRGSIEVWEMEPPWAT